MSEKTVITCDHCGVTAENTMKFRFTAMFVNGAYDMPNLDACSREHLGLALAKAFGLPIDAKAAELFVEHAKSEARRVFLETEVKRLEARIAELERQDRDAFTPNPISMMVDSWANPKKEWDAANGKTPGTLARDVFCQGVPDLDSRVIGGAAAKSWELAAQAVLRAFGQPRQTTQDAVEALPRVRDRVSNEIHYEHKCLILDIVDDELAKLETKPATNAEAVAMYEATKDAARRAFPDEPQAITLPTKPTKPLRERLEELASYWEKGAASGSMSEGYRQASKDCAKELREVINDSR